MTRAGRDGSPQDAPLPRPGLLAALAGKLRRRLAEGPFARRVSIGLRRDLADPFTPPPARLPLRLRDFRPDDLPALFPPGCDPAALRERADIAWRLDQVARGAFASRCLVAVDARTDRPCHVLWLTRPGYSERVRLAGALPRLNVGEAMIENAFTPTPQRGLGHMTTAVCLLAAQAAAEGTRALVIVIDVDNAASLAAARRAGLSDYTRRVWDQYGFGLVRRVRFVPVAGERAGATPGRIAADVPRRS